MKLCQTTADLQEEVALAKAAGKSIGLVPTMGALHEGHGSLITAARKENELVIVSVFVNPTQFNDKHDLETYPRTLDKDCTLLEPVGCDYVFAPSAEEMYPEPDTRTFDFGTVSAVMEGARRPGHFNGVAQIVSKLFYVVEPDNRHRTPGARLLRGKRFPADRCDPCYGEAIGYTGENQRLSDFARGRRFGFE